MYQKLLPSLSHSILAFSLLLSAVLIGQVRHSARGIYFQTKGGFLMAHRSTMAHLVRENAYGFELGVIKHLQSDAKSADKHYPAIGANLEFRNFGYDEVLGKAISISHFINTPIFQSEDFFIDFQYGTGIGYITNKYHLTDNPKNNAIGSNFNAKVALKLLFTKHIKRNAIGLGIEMTHFSNGVITYPNLGLNIPSLFLQVGFLDYRRAAYVKSEVHLSEVFNVVKKHNFLISTMFTAKQVRANPNLPKRYPVFGLRGTYKYCHSRRWSWDASIDLIHNEANLFVYSDSTFSRSDVLQIGIYGGAAYHFYKSEIVMGLGFYLRDKINPIARMYNKIGYRYYFSSKWFGLFNVRANLGKADFFEFGFGYKLK